MKKLCLISVVVICGLLCFAPLAFCGVDMVSIQFDSGTLYGIVRSADLSTWELVSINVSTGALTAIGGTNSFGTSSSTIVGFGENTCINSTGHIIYAIKGGTSDGNDSYIISINTQTGAVTVSPALHF
jgi:hypothetical protein